MHTMVQGLHILTSLGVFPFLGFLTMMVLGILKGAEAKVWMLVAGPDICNLQGSKGNE